MDPVTLDGYVIKNFIRQPDGSLLCRDDNQTTMTADVLSNIFSNKSFIWKGELNNMGGVFADMVNTITAELKAYNKSTLNFAQIAYESNENDNTGSFIVSFNIKKGSVKYNPGYYVTIEKVNDNQVRFTVAPQGNSYGELYAKNCPTIRQFVDTFAASAYDLKANSLLAPVRMTMSQSGSAGNYIIWDLQ